MRVSKILLVLAGLTAASPVLAQTYRAPVGNCDGAVMVLEAARTANVKATAALTAAMNQDKIKVCSAATLKLADARQAAANSLSQRATRLLAACPGMDDAMEQGAKMAAQSKTELADAAKARQNLVSSCGPALQ